MTRAQDAARCLNELTPPLVVKPLNGNQGKGVTLGVRTAGDLWAAFDRAAAVGRDVVEEEFAGRDYRVLVVGGMRWPAWTYSTASRIPVMLRLWVRTWQTRPVLAAVSAGARPSRTLWLAGFSTYTSLPARTVHTATVACQWFGVATMTASTDLSSSTVTAVLVGAVPLVGA